MGEEGSKWESPDSHFGLFDFKLLAKRALRPALLPTTPIAATQKLISQVVLTCLLKALLLPLTQFSKFTEPCF